MSLLDDARTLRLFRRWLTPAGNFPAQAVLAGASAHAVSFPRAEADVTYGVTVCPSWLTTFRVTSKTVTGFTIDFGTLAPAGATVDVSTFRTE